jgi:hypothetical protein
MILLLLHHSLRAQPNSSPRSGKFLKDAVHVLGGAGRVLTSPARWHGKDWAIFGSVLAGTLALSYLDEPFDDLMQRNRSRFADDLSELGIEYGEPRTVVVLTGGLYAVGLIADSDWLRESCVIASASLLSNGIIQSTTKVAAGRARPHVGLGHDVFDPFRGEENYYSFFSGHTMVAMIMSHTFAKRIDHSVAKVALYSLGTVAGLARTYNCDHWLTDVVLGNALAIVSVNSAAKWLEAKKDGKTLGRLQWRVTPINRGVSLSVTW